MEHDSERAEALLAVAALWMPGNSEVHAWLRSALDATYVALAEDQPYIMIDGEIFDEYTFDEPNDIVQPLLDCLMYYDHLTAFDWKASPEDIRGQLEALLSYPRGLPWNWYPAFLRDCEGLHAGDVAERFLETLGEHCYGHGIALLAVDTQSDSYAMTFMPTDLAVRQETTI
ncbi:DUF6630 family protein [Nocardia aurantiaca]|uniref:DUF6630 domain-containing protein n=1 Tax=Nocardia aurantiaca TaxID=2675850 RepID=A0A6I3L923_9NOCA|nr:hypothetical protein [Nocardia aurantiaca]MTE16925.1 hypothetical protein [Nocardia aurantiaca]